MFLTGEIARDEEHRDSDALPSREYRPGREAETVKKGRKYRSRHLLRLFPFVRELEIRAKRLQAEADSRSMYQRPGHFYSPLPSLDEIEKAFARADAAREFEGVDLAEEKQLVVLDEIIRTYPEIPFPEEPTDGWRYHLNNESYGAVDGVMLHGMIRYLRPKRIIEVGSGYSSAAMLDLNDRVFDGGIDLTIIDPDTTSLRARCRTLGFSNATCIEKEVQDAPLEIYSTLRANDILFIDSSHVSKVGSDLNHLFFHVLPVLNPGVYVHLHDITWSLEYPREWLEEGRAWNEQYLLRAFLMYNSTFRVALFPPWLLRHYRARVVKGMPRCEGGGGGQIWLRRMV